jgi:hypothetical protein
MNLRSSLRTLAFASVCALPLPAGMVTINFTETGGNVVVTLSGSLTDATVWTSIGQSGAVSAIIPSTGIVQFGGTVTDTYLAPTVTNTGLWTGGFGSGGPNIANSSSGGPFSFSPYFTTLGNQVGSIQAGTTVASLSLPSGYSFSSPTNLSSTMTFTGKTFATLGITTGTYEAIYGQDKIQLTFGSGGGSSVPDAGPGPVLALLLGGLGLRQWHSSRRSRAAA